MIFFCMNIIFFAKTLRIIYSSLYVVVLQRFIIILNRLTVTLKDGSKLKIYFNAFFKIVNRTKIRLLVFGWKPTVDFFYSVS